MCCLASKTSEDRREQSDAKQTRDCNLSVQGETLFLAVVLKSKEHAI